MIDAPLLTSFNALTLLVVSYNLTCKSVFEMTYHAPSGTVSYRGESSVQCPIKERIRPTIRAITVSVNHDYRLHRRPFN